MEAHTVAIGGIHVGSKITSVSPVEVTFCRQKLSLFCSVGGCALINREIKCL